MKRHALPQNIMDIEFKLFGALTLSQFVNLAANVIIAVVIFTLPLPVVIKWPIMIFFVIIGLALALVTINGQPFSTWLGNFVLALATSQRRVWKKTPETPEMLKSKYKPTGKYQTHLVSTSKKKVQDSMPLVTESAKLNAVEIDQKEDKELAAIDSHIQKNFSTDELKPTEPNIETEEKQDLSKIPPIIDHSKQKLGTDVELNNPNVQAIQTGPNLSTVIRTQEKSPSEAPRTAIPTDALTDILSDITYEDNIPTSSPSETKVQQPGNTSKLSSSNPPVVVAKQPIDIDNAQTAPNINFTEKSIDLIKDQSKVQEENIKNLQGEISGLQDNLTTLQNTDTDHKKQEEYAKNIDMLTENLEKETKQTADQIQDTSNIKQVSKPNVISGYVYDKQNAPIMNVSVEIKDKNGFPLRKTTTNKLGYFIFTTPLDNGDFIIDFEQRGRKFIDFKIVLNGKILPPYKFTES